MPFVPAWLVDICITILCFLPLLLTAHVPETDLPNHLARQYIIRDLGSSDYLRTFYEIRLQLVPNLGLDAFVDLARQIMPIDWAVRAFCITTMLLLFYGTRLVSVHMNRGGLRIYRIAPLLCYGGPVQFGFLSFCFGVGLSLVMFGCYIRLRKAPLRLQFVAFAPFAFLLMLCHLAAFGLFAVAACAYELGRALDVTPWRTNLLRRLVPASARIACWLVPPFALFMLLGPPGNFGSPTLFSTPRQKLEGIAAITLFSAPQVELSLLLLAAAGLGTALVTGVVRFRPEGLAIVVIQGVIWLALPRVALAGGFIDYRVPWAISFYLLATLSSPAPLTRTRLATGLATLFAGLAVVRIASICLLWLSWEPVIDGIDHALGTLPPGSRIKVVLGSNPSASASRRPELTHLAAYAVARRQAFEPQMFASIGGQILYFRPPYDQSWSAAPNALASLPPGFDYVLVLAPRFAQVATSLPLTCERSGAEFELFRIRRQDVDAGVIACP